jgi:hypothetical protein
MGLIVSVYRSAETQDCTNRGVSSRYGRLCITNVPGPFFPVADMPGAVLETGPYGSLRIVPSVLKDSDKWFMFGGNFAYSSDGRWREQVMALAEGNHDGPVAIHDRVE